MKLQFSGIVKVPSDLVHIQPWKELEAAVASHRHKLLDLCPSKWHVTLLHQSVGGLKDLCKLVKKFEKGKLDSDPCLYPSTELPQIDTEGAEVIVVTDTHPTSGEERKTVRIVLRGELQAALGAWVGEFCELNSLERDATELERVYHISYANLTGLPADSVR